MMTRTTWCAAATAVVFLSGVSAVLAQAPATLARVTVQGEAAKRIMTKTQINAETARALVDACVDFGSRPTAPTRCSCSRRTATSSPRR
jgi:hypothetical protein